LTKRLQVQSPGRTYSRRHLKSSHSLSQARSTRAFSRADLIPYLNVSQSYVVAARPNQSPPPSNQTSSTDSQSYVTADIQARKHAGTRPSQEISIRPTERQRHGQSTSWSLCTDTELYTGSHTESYTESMDMEHISAELGLDNSTVA
jgi:hypothetical protein